jgi:y4mF family transcriptional regulator
MKAVDQFVKDKRKETRLTQQELAEKAGVALTVIRKIEQRKGNLNLEKVNQVLRMFGHVLAPVSIRALKDLEENNP